MCLEELSANLERLISRRKEIEGSVRKTLKEMDREIRETIEYRDM